MSNQQEKETKALTLKDLIKSKDSFLGSTIKETLNQEVEKYGDKTFDNVKEFANTVTTQTENSYPLADKIYYFVKFNGKTKSYFVKRDLEKSPKTNKKEN